MKILLFLSLSISCHAASLTFSSHPSPLIITKAFPGRQPFTAIDTSTTCDLIVPHGKSVTILAALNTPLPAHTTLKIGFSFPHLNSSPLSLETTPQTIVSNISEGIYNSIYINYEYTAKVTAGVIPPQTRTVFFTLIEGGI